MKDYENFKSILARDGVWGERRETPQAVRQPNLYHQATARPLTPGLRTLSILEVLQYEEDRTVPLSNPVKHLVMTRI